MQLIVTPSHTGNDIHNLPKVSAHYLNMGGDYIAVTYLGVEKICIHLNHAVHSLKSVICTSHLLPGCYGQQECKEQGNESTSTCLLWYYHKSVLIFTCKLYEDFPWRVRLLTQKKSGLKSAHPIILHCFVFLICHTLYGPIDCVAFKAHLSMQDDS